MKKITTLLLFVSLTIAANMTYAAQTIKAEVNGMVCAFCAQGIEKKVRSLPQTKDVYISLQKKIIAVEIKEGQTLSTDNLKEVVKNAGYDVTNIQIVTETAQQIKASIGGSK